MVRSFPYIRFLVVTLLAAWLGYLVQKDPGQLTLTIPEKGVSVTVPQSLEGWKVERGQGDVLATGHTRLRTMSLEIVEVPVTHRAQIDGYIKERDEQFRVGKQDYIVWHQGTDYKFGNRYAPAYKATYTDRFLGLPIKAEYWQYDVYWPYKDHFVRIGMRFPEVLSRYVDPDKIFIASGLRLAQR